MEFNPSKCSAIRPSGQKSHDTVTVVTASVTSRYYLQGRTLETPSASKHLGITISSDLSWATHAEDVLA